MRYSDVEGPKEVRPGERFRCIRKLEIFRIRDTT